MSPSYRRSQPTSQVRGRRPSRPPRSLYSRLVRERSPKLTCPIGYCAWRNTAPPKVSEEEQKESRQKGLAMCVFCFLPFFLLDLTNVHFACISHSFCPYSPLFFFAFPFLSTRSTSCLNFRLYAYPKIINHSSRDSCSQRKLSPLRKIRRAST